MRKTESRLLIGITAVVVILVIFAGLYPFKGSDEWLGIGENSNKSESREKTIKDGKIISTKEIKHFQSAKTLWNCLELASTLAIPVVLFQFQVSEQRRAEKRAEVEKEIASANLRDEALEAYLDRIAELLLSEEYRSKLFDKQSSDDNSIRDLARIRTVTILRRLENDRKRQRQVLEFLRDAELFDFIFIAANLDGINLFDANLEAANLESANLFHANLSRANLSRANLNYAHLINADLSLAVLIGAELNYAHLNNANMEGAYIENADFRSANLKDACLSKANLTNANLTNTNLTNANLINTNLINAKNLTPEQVKAAKNWDKAQYDPEFRKLLGLLYHD